MLVLTQRPSLNRSDRAFAPGSITFQEEKKFSRFVRRIWDFSLEELSAQ